MIFDLDRYKLISVTPLTGATGAEIEGVDTARPIDAATFKEIRQAFLDHHVIFFRDQAHDSASLSAFAELFAPLTKAAQSKKDGADLAARFTRTADTPVTVRNFGDRWHADQAARERPNMGVALYCTEAPPYGGDTLFANLCMAYDYLSPALKAICDGLIGLHSPSSLYGPDGRGGVGNTKSYLETAKNYNETYSTLTEEALAFIRSKIEHPLVRTHPETGRPILYVTGYYMYGIKGMTDLESQPLLEQLGHHVTRPEFQCRFRWKAGSLAVWDNRCVQHYAVNDYEGFDRSMLRVEMEGDRPFGPAMPRPDQETSRTLEPAGA